MQYATLSLSELKVLAAQNNVIPTGDKRSKQSWIDALELAASLETIQEIEPAETIDIAVDIWTIDTPVESEPTPANPLLGGAIESEIHIGVGRASKKGAATIFITLLCAIAITIRSAFTVAAAAIRACIHLRNMFGSYNPDYDFLYQLTLLAAPVEHPSRPAY
jgi:hypothetical protein